MGSDPGPRFVPAAVRRPARSVLIGDVIIGGDHPIAVQSMTTTRTADARATASQIVRLARAGCDLVRVTVPSRPDAEALPEIRRLMRREGVRVPLIADIHFTPRVAMLVVDHVEKVRINPGNFADRKDLDGRPYDQARWARDVERAYDLFAPLVDRARTLGVALRIGTNHGSLSDRIVQRFGDTPAGMVESALEFVRVCQDRGHHNVVISMKASNTVVMVRAYRLLARRLEEEGIPLPLHLGVTEAGGGDEGRIKSAAGMGTLLAEGLGDTLRVSLTEDPVNEIPVARELVARFAVTLPGPAPAAALDIGDPRNPLDPSRRLSQPVCLGELRWGGEEVPRVELILEDPTPATALEVLAARPAVEMVDVLIRRPEDLEGARCFLAAFKEQVPARALTLATPEARAAFRDTPSAADWGSLIHRLGAVVDPEADDLPALAAALGPWPKLFILRLAGEWPGNDEHRVIAFARGLAACPGGTAGALCRCAGGGSLFPNRLLAALLDEAGSPQPIVLVDSPDPAEDPRVATAGRLAALLLDGIGDAVRMRAGPDPAGRSRLLHDILQAARRRLERADFIACPSCGRTLFDLEETTARVKALTAHLKLKIAVMGCVVNGPGEMADADFGYVGWGAGKVALFAGREMVEKDIPGEAAPERLVNLIKSRGRWTDPPPR